MHVRWLGPIGHDQPVLRLRTQRSSPIWLRRRSHVPVPGCASYAATGILSAHRAKPVVSENRAGTLSSTAHGSSVDPLNSFRMFRHRQLSRCGLAVGNEAGRETWLRKNPAASLDPGRRIVRIEEEPVLA